MTNTETAKQILGYVPSGYVCCSQTCTYVQRGRALRLVGHVSVNGKTIASVLLDETLRIVNVSEVA